MKNYDKQTIAQIRKPIVWAAIIMLVFYAIEIPMVHFNVFPDVNTLYIADIIVCCIQCFRNGAAAGNY